MSKRKQAPQRGADRRRSDSDTATYMLRVRLTPKEHDDLVFWAHPLDVSEYVRLATRRYHGVIGLTVVLGEDLTSRALTTFECNLLATVNPDYYLEAGGAELTKPPAERHPHGAPFDGPLGP